jgi:hypothetical protein
MTRWTQRFGCLMLIALPALASAQAPRFDGAVDAGYTHLYHAGGPTLDAVLLRRLGSNGSIVQLVGAEVIASRSDVATGSRSALRSTEELGLRYEARFAGTSGLAPFLGARVGVARTATSDEIYFVTNGVTSLPAHREDYNGLSATGRAAAILAGARIPLSSSLALLAEAAGEHVSIVRGESTHLAWSVTTGVSMLIR